MAIKSRDMTMIVVGCAVVAAIVGGILNCFVLPIGYIITHDCGKWICDHNYPVTWGSYAIVTSVVFLFLLFIAIIGESSSNNGTTTYRRKSKTHRRRNYNYSSRETDYYDSDMEGAPGYNGFD